VDIRVSFIVSTDVLLVCLSHSLFLSHLLQFDLTGKFDAKGLLDSIPESLNIAINGDYSLLGSLMFGSRITVDTVSELLKSNSAIIDISRRLTISFFIFSVLVTQCRDPV